MNQTSCPCCNTVLTLPDEAIGLRVRCTHCQSKFIILADGTKEVLDWKTPESTKVTPIELSKAETTEKETPPSPAKTNEASPPISKENLIRDEIPMPRPRGYTPPISNSVEPPPPPQFHGHAPSNNFQNPVRTPPPMKNQVPSAPPPVNKFVIPATPEEDPDKPSTENSKKKEGSGCLSTFLGVIVIILAGVCGYVFFAPNGLNDLSDLTNKITSPNNAKTSGGKVTTPIKTLPKKTSKRPFVLPKILDGYDDDMGEFGDEIVGEEGVDVPVITPLDDLPKDFRAYQNECDELLQKFESGMTEKKKVEAVIENPDLCEKLLHFTFIHDVTPEGITKVRNYKKGEEFLKFMLGDRTLVEDFLASGGLTNPARCLELYYMIYANDSELNFMRSNTYRNLALACALSGHSDNYQVMDQYRTFVRFHKRGELHPTFDKLSVKDMRYICTYKNGNSRSSGEDLRYVVGQNTRPMNRYTESVWYPQYQLYNHFGTSVQESDYLRPWDHVFGWMEATHKIGGVCGSLSHYGMVSARAHGVPSITGGQPAHCAVIFRKDNGEWQIGNYVGQYTGFHHNPYFWELTTFSAASLIDDMFKDRVAIVNSHYYTWLAQHMIYAKVNPGVVFIPESVQAYECKEKTLPDFAQMKSYKSVKCSNFDLSVAGRNNSFALVFKGKILVKTPGNYAIRLASDDGSQLFIDSKLVIDNNGSHGMDPMNAEVTLNTENTFELTYFQGDGAKGLQVFAEPKECEMLQEVINAFEEAVKYVPCNYPAWDAYGKYITQTQEKSLMRWMQWAQNLAIAFNDHEEQGWKLIHRYAAPAIFEVGAESSLLPMLIDCHRLMPESKRPTPERYNFPAVLDQQSKFLKNNMNSCLSLFEKIAEIYYGSPSSFTAAMRWGANLFLSDEDYAAEYIKILQKIVNGKDKDEKNTLGPFLNGAIRKSSETGNNSVFQQLCDLQDQVAPPQNKEPFLKSNKKLLSKKALLQTSSTSQYDNPGNYRRCIDESQPAGFHTDKENTPWAMIVLPNDCMVEEIYIRNVDGQNASRSVPFTILISTDNKEWRRIYTASKVSNEFIIKLPKPVRARYIKAERKNNNYKEFFHFTKFQVYGTTLY